MGGPPERPPASAPTLKGHRQVCSTYPSLEKYKKLECRDYNEKLNQQYFEAAVRLVNQVTP